jgi:C-terminal of Roc, COR, domain/Ras of Complex, Roc, domain of DAPkinase
VTLNEAKLILIGEGEVGKSCLLGALRNDPWAEGSPTTHGIEIKPVEVAAPGTGTKITLNGWDFGGQRVYRPTHQLFFTGDLPCGVEAARRSATGLCQGVDYARQAPRARSKDYRRGHAWRSKAATTRHRPAGNLGPVRQGHGGRLLAGGQQAGQEGKRKGIAELKQTIARAAASLPEMGRKVPKRWEETRQALAKTGGAYLPLEQVQTLCRDRKMDEDEAKHFVRISHLLGHLMHYEHDPLLRDIVVLKPDFLSKAVSFALDDEQTRKAHGLVSFARLGQLWGKPAGWFQGRKMVHKQKRAVAGRSSPAGLLAAMLSPPPSVNSPSYPGGAGLGKITAPKIHVGLLMRSKLLKQH